MKKRDVMLGSRHAWPCCPYCAPPMTKQARRSYKRREKQSWKREVKSMQTS